MSTGVNFASTLVATNIPSTLDSSAILTGTSGGATTAGGQFGSGINTLVVTSEATKTLDSASLETAGAKVDRAGFSVTLVVTVTRLSRSVGRLAGGRSGSGGSGVTFEVVAIPVPSLRALRRRHLGRWVVGDTASLTGVPVPAGRRALITTGGLGRVGRSTVRKATILLAEVEVTVIAVIGGLRGSSRSRGFRRSSRGGRLLRSRWGRGLLGGSRGCGLRWLRRGVTTRGSGVTLQPRLVPRPTTVTGRGSLLFRRSVGNTASLTRVPAPTVGRALGVLRRSRWAGWSTARNTAVTLREVELVRFTVLVSRGQHKRDRRGEQKNAR